VYDFLFVIIELFSLALTVEALQGKRCQDSLLSGEGRSLGAKISGEGVVPGEYLRDGKEVQIQLTRSRHGLSKEPLNKVQRSP